MYEKELKERFRKFVIHKAKLASLINDVDSCMWNCLYYFSGLNDAIYIAKQYDSYMRPFTVEKFDHIFKSLVEYRKGVH